MSPERVPVSYRCWRCREAVPACDLCLSDWREYLDINTPCEAVLMARAGRDEDWDATEAKEAARERAFLLRIADGPPTKSGAKTTAQRMLRRLA